MCRSNTKVKILNSSSKNKHLKGSYNNNQCRKKGFARYFFGFCKFNTRVISCFESLTNRYLMLNETYLSFILAFKKDFNQVLNLPEFTWINLKPISVKTNSGQMHLSGGAYVNEPKLLFHWSDRFGLTSSQSSRWFKMKILALSGKMPN